MANGMSFPECESGHGHGVGAERTWGRAKCECKNKPKERQGLGQGSGDQILGLRADSCVLSHKDAAAPLIMMAAAFVYLAGSYLIPCHPLSRRCRSGSPEAAELGAISILLEIIIGSRHPAAGGGEENHAK
jgi:hypothetical protein